MSNELMEAIIEAQTNPPGPVETPTDWEKDCEDYLKIDAQIKELNKKLNPIKERLKKFGNHHTENFQVVLSEAHAFRIKGFKDFEKKGWTKDKLTSEGLGANSISIRLAVSKL